MDKKKRKQIERLSADHERWDAGELGRSEEHLRVLSAAEERDIDEGLGLQHISLRLNKILIEQLKELAKLEGLGYQPLIRQVLTKYVKENEHKLDKMLCASDAVQRADKLFAKAIRRREEIPTFPPLSNQRILAETDCTQALSQAQALFAQAYENSTDAVVRQHAKLRLGQIAGLCQEGLRAPHAKKDRKRKRNRNRAV